MVVLRQHLNNNFISQNWEQKLSSLTDYCIGNESLSGIEAKSNYKIPQLIFDIINQVWDADPLKRPNARKLCNLIFDISRNKVDSIIYGQPFTRVGLLDFKKSPEPKNADKHDDLEYSASLKMDLLNLILILKMKVIKLRLL
ncbi:unnamed protein product [Rhizophagus irregularis]|nr:unnamed protein product [Rhizophagus irregularis]